MSKQKVAKQPKGKRIFIKPGLYRNFSFDIDTDLELYGEDVEDAPAIDAHHEKSDRKRCTQ